VVETIFSGAKPPYSQMIQETNLAPDAVAGYIDAFLRKSDSAGAVNAIVHSAWRIVHLGE
jgi:hypothetical protein